jgi:hypothetical protein
LKTLAGTSAVTLPAKLYADAGYDTEWVMPSEHFQFPPSDFS